MQILSSRRAQIRQSWLSSRATFQNYSHEEVHKYHVIVVGMWGERIAGSVLRDRVRSCLDLDEPESSNRSERAVAIVVWLSATLLD